MFGLFVLAVGSLALLSPALARSASTAQSVAQGRPLLFDRIGITKRLIEGRSGAKPASIAIRPSVLPQALHYRTIRMVQCPVDCFASDVNDAGQISILRFVITPPQPPAVINDNGDLQPLSMVLGSISNRYDTATATALNDTGGVAGNFVKSTFQGNLVWQVHGGAYEVLYYDGWDAGAQASAINDYDISAGVSGTTDLKHVQQASIFGPTYRRHALLPLHESCSSVTPSFATGINDAGVIVGFEETCEDSQAVRFSTFGYAKAILPPPPPFGFASAAEAVNQLGDVVGFAGPDLTYGATGKAFLYRAACTCVQYLPRPAGEANGFYYALAVNLSDQIVGDIVDPKDEFNTAFLYTGGVAYDLNALLPANSGWTINSAVAINNAGEIVGSGDYVDPTTGILQSNAIFALTP